MILDPAPVTGVDGVGMYQGWGLAEHPVDAGLDHRDGARKERT
jgi:hypothetical protein